MLRLLSKTQTRRAGFSLVSLCRGLRASKMHKLVAVVSRDGCHWKGVWDTHVVMVDVMKGLQKTNALLDQQLEVEWGSIWATQSPSSCRCPHPDIGIYRSLHLPVVPLPVVFPRRPF